MVNLIVKFLEGILTIAAALIAVAFLIAGIGMGGKLTGSPIGSVYGGVVGLFVGFIVAVVILGIPIVLLKINQNLEIIRNKLSLTVTGRADN